MLREELAGTIFTIAICASKEGLYALAMLPLGTKEKERGVWRSNEDCLAIASIDLDS